jgi:hypothetical protein
MFTPDQTATILISIVGGAFAGAMTVYLSRQANKRLEQDEVRKRKIGIIYDLLGSRYVLQADYPASPDEVRIFNTAISLFPVFYHLDREVMTAFDRFHDSKTDDNLIALLRAAAKVVNLEPFDSSLRRVVTVKPGVLLLRKPTDAEKGAA